MRSSLSEVRWRAGVLRSSEGVVIITGAPNAGGSNPGAGGLAAPQGTAPKRAPSAYSVSIIRMLSLIASAKSTALRAAWCSCSSGGSAA